MEKIDEIRDFDCADICFGTTWWMGKHKGSVCSAKSNNTALISLMDCPATSKKVTQPQMHRISHFNFSAINLIGYVKSDVGNLGENGKSH